MNDSSRTAVRISVRGVVQGVGFRPFVYSLALRYGLRGWVLNTSAGVEVLAEGEPDAVAGFAEALPLEAPPRSHIAACEVREVQPGAAADGPAAGEGFVILESRADPGAYQLVSPDIATCDDCRRELLDPGDRRHDYPFTNCTNCGPRFTIIEDLPYDRGRTTMRHFPLCPACRREYEDPADRRFHAEPNACPVCGPRVRLLRRRGGGLGGGGRRRRRRPGGSRPRGRGAAARRRDPRRQGSRRLPPGLRRHRRRGGAPPEAAQAAPRQASRGDVRRPRGAARPLPRERGRGEPAALAGTSDRPPRVAGRRTVRRGRPGAGRGAGRRRRRGGRAASLRLHRGRRPPALPRRDAAVHAAARAAAARRRPAPGHDERQPGRGADRQGLGGDRPPHADRRRLSGPRPGDRRALRRLRRAGARRDGRG